MKYIKQGIQNNQLWLVHVFCKIPKTLGAGKTIVDTATYIPQLVPMTLDIMGAKEMTQKPIISFLYTRKEPGHQDK